MLLTVSYDLPASSVPWRFEAIGANFDVRKSARQRGKSRHGDDLTRTAVSRSRLPRQWYVPCLSCGIMTTNDTASAQSTAPHVIIVATDFSDVSRLAVKQAWKLATERADAQLHAIHVIDDRKGLESKTEYISREEHLLATMPATLRDHVVECAEEAGLGPLNRPLGIHVRLGSPATQIMQLAVDLDAAMIVVGSHGKHGLDKLLLGSVSEKLVRNAGIPVLVSRPKNFEGVAHSEGLDPPCPDCLEVRHRTGGEKWWCDLHAREHVPTHIYSSTEVGSFTKEPFDFEGGMTGGR